MLNSSETNQTFPSAAKAVNDKILEVSSNFRKQVVWSVIAIIGFVICYLILLCLAAVFCVICVYAGVSVIFGVGSIIGLLLGVGCIVLGFMTLFFLIKFVFKSSKKDLSGMIEINAGDQPKLFEFIAQIASETKTKLPKRVFLSGEVNAYVFFDSSFWSLFIPVRKNLTIGLGLVNSVNVTELKAVIAHEFGHFSQKSMVIGSYVYNVNRVLFDMLYDNGGYQRILNFWSSISGWLAIFGWINVFIVRGIISILQVLYKIVNLPYRKLSREMEFHADAVSASVTGSEPLISALRRLEFAELSMQNLVNFYNDRTNIGRYPQNIFEQHTRLMKKEAGLKKYGFENGLPIVGDDYFDEKANSKLRFKDLWATHPEIKDRESRLKKFNLPTNWNNTPSWSLVEQANKIQENISTINLDDFKLSEYKKVGADDFWREYEKMLAADELPKLYNGYYDNRLIEGFNLDEIILDKNKSLSLDQLYTAEYAEKGRKLGQITNDLYVLQQLVESKTKIAMLEYEGEKYTSHQLPGLVIDLTKQVEIISGEILQHDINCYSGHLNKGDAQTKEELRKAYNQLFKAKEMRNEYIVFCNEIMGVSQFIYMNPNDENNSKNHAYFKSEEKKLKDKMIESMKDAVFSSVLSQGEKDFFEFFVNQNRVYIFQNKPVEESFQGFIETMFRWEGFLSAAIQSKQRKTLELQARII
jgi:Zn-dependent protease with chaperone function